MYVGSRFFLSTFVLCNFMKNVESIFLVVADVAVFFDADLFFVIFKKMFV